MVEIVFLNLQQAALLRQAGQPQAALDAARSAAKTLESRDLTVRLAQAHLTMADCLLDLDRVEEAAFLYTAALKVAEREYLVPLAYRARYGLGRVAELSREDKIASEHHTVAMAHLEAIHRDLRVDEFQASFMDDKLEVYEAAVRLALRRGDVEAAFDYVEQAKAGALLDLLSRELELPPVPSTVEGVEQGNKLLERLRTLREQWHCTPVNWKVIHLVKMMTLFVPVPNDTVLLEYYAVGNEMLVFLVNHHDVEVIRLETTADELEMLITTWRFDLDSLRLMLPDLSPVERTALESDSQFYLQQLYQVLIAPIYEQLAPYDRLIVAPHGPLHYLPFVALHDGQEHLLERFQISYLPGASLLQLGETLKVSKPTSSADFQSLSRPLILAHTDDGRLSHTLREVRQVEAVLAEATVFVEDKTTEARLREYGLTCGLLHLATHGAFRADTPLFSWLRLADTRLTVRDIHDLRLPHASLVTLSTCETGLGDPRGGDVLGLSQSFLAAGARSLLLSLWAVDDVSTAQLMTAFYQRLAVGQSKASALQKAQQGIRGIHPHPFYWAGFVLIGEIERL